MASTLTVRCATCPASAVYDVDALGGRMGLALAAASAEGWRWGADSRRRCGACGDGAGVPRPLVAGERGEDVAPPPLPALEQLDLFGSWA
jgi:hypothetical protein